MARLVYSFMNCTKVNKIGFSFSDVKWWVLWCIFCLFVNSGFFTWSFNEILKKSRTKSTPRDFFFNIVHLIVWLDNTYYITTYYNNVKSQPIIKNKIKDSAFHM